MHCTLRCEQSQDTQLAQTILTEDAAALQEYKGYIFKIMGGQDKQGFGMKQGVLTPGRVQLLMTPGDSCFRGFGRRNGERRRKSVRGCIVSQDLSVLNLAIVKKGALQPWVTLPGNDLSALHSMAFGPSRMCCGIATDCDAWI